MIARYDQDLTPFFEHIRQLERERREERKRARREMFAALARLFGRRQKA